MKRLKVVDFGSKAQGIDLRGDRRNPEPMHVRIVFPGGEVDVVRTSDEEYWVHVSVNSEEDVILSGHGAQGKLVDARLDIRTMHTSDVKIGDFNHPDLYHLAVRIALKK